MALSPRECVRLVPRFDGTRFQKRFEMIEIKKMLNFRQVAKYVFAVADNDNGFAFRQRETELDVASTTRSALCFAGAFREGDKYIGMEQVVKVFFRETPRLFMAWLFVLHFVVAANPSTCHAMPHGIQFRRVTGEFKTPRIAAGKIEFQGCSFQFSYESR
jgi:hypothetical protein